MADPLLSTLDSSINDEELVTSNPLGIVTNRWIAFRLPNRPALIILSLDSITSLQIIWTTNPGLLVIAGGLFLIGAGAYCSKTGVATAAVIGFLGIIFLTAYLAGWRGSVVFATTRDTVETSLGNTQDARDLARAATAAIADIDKRELGQVELDILDLEIKEIDAEVLATLN